MNALAARLLAALVAIAFVATACGDDTATTDTTTDSATDTAQPTAAAGDSGDGAMKAMDDADEHDHGDGIEVHGFAVPRISISVEPDPASGQNLFVELRDFTIAPEHASTEPVDGEGHLHLYVDGERQARFYNTALHLDLEPGSHTVEVEVSANNHSAYTVDGEPIRASVTVDVPDAEPTHMAHDPIEVAEGSPAPDITLDVEPDPKSGWNLFVGVENFTIDARAASTAPVEGHGHLHLYLDGQKIGRMYGTAWHLAELTEGEHEIAVEVSANDHSPYTVGGEAIRAVATVVVTADQATESADHADEHGDDDHGEGGSDHDHGDVGDFDAAIDEDTADVVIAVDVSGGAVATAESRVGVERGQTVALVVSSDTDEELHLHGYDLLAPLTADSSSVLGFTADIPGVFEIELERSGAFVVEVEVS